MIASGEDGRHLNLTLQKEVEFSQNIQGCAIDLIRELIYDEEHQQYFILANKYNEKLGFFVIKISETNPTQCKFLIKWSNRLDIGDTSMTINRCKVKGLKELVVSFKTIYINTYNVVVMDITIEGTPSMIFRHESFQLWESECTGFML